MTAQAQLLAWHYRLGHISFEKIRQMAKRGDLPAKLADCKVPRCAACHFGKQTRRSWRSKAPVNRNKIPPVTVPGSVVSVDQIVGENLSLSLLYMRDDYVFVYSNAGLQLYYYSGLSIHSITIHDCIYDYMIPLFLKILCKLRFAFQ